MRQEELAKLALDNQEFMCYIVDLENLELLYVNEATKKTLSSRPHKSFEGVTCYEYLHGLKSPCKNCNNYLLEPNKKLRKEVQNAYNKKYYAHLDTLIEIDNKLAKLAFVFDPALGKEEFENIANKLTLEQTLVKCIETLLDDSDIDQGINKLLEIVGQFYDADRSYLFEIDNTQRTALNSYEWARDSAYSSIEINPLLKLDQLKPLLEIFQEQGEIALYDIEREVDKNSELYQLLKYSRCHSILVVPLSINGRIKFFMGVDNPRRMQENLSLLHSIIIFVADDIKKRKIHKQLEHLSYTDILTGLYNRNKYIHYLEDLDLNALNSLGFININVNGLKQINELYGEQHGDKILKEVAKVFKSHIEQTKGDIFRLSGDEFVAFCPNVSSKDFEELVSRLRIEENNKEEFSFAVGGVWQDKRLNITQGLSQANDIMFAEKQSYYRNQTNDSIQTRSNPVNILLKEIKDGYFSVYLQPKVLLETGEIIGAEALIRKHNNQGKLISPDFFVPIYENEGTIRHIDFFVLEETCKLLQKLIKENKAIPIAVNFSRVTFISYDLIDEIVNTCAKYEIPHSLIKIELTESIDKMDFNFFNKKLKAIREAGFDIALDDFGAKHSNLLMLTMSEFTEVKIDKGLIDNIVLSAQNHTVVHNILRAIDELGTSSCVAEGIENIEQKTILQNLGCTHGQGYYFYRPMPIVDFLEIYQGKSKQDIVDTNANLNVGVHFNFTPQKMFEIIDKMPLGIHILSSDHSYVVSNNYIVELFDLKSRKMSLEEFHLLSPEFQPDGSSSQAILQQNIEKARKDGKCTFHWLHHKANSSEKIPCELTFVYLQKASLFVAFVKDLRQQLYDYSTNEWATNYLSNDIPIQTLFNAITDFTSEWVWAYSYQTKEMQFYGLGSDVFNLKNTKAHFPEVIRNSGILCEDDLAEFDAIAEAIELGIVRSADLRFILPDGCMNYYRVSYNIVSDTNGKPLFAAGKTENIEEFKTAELLAQKDQLTSCYNKVTAEKIIQNIINANKQTQHALFIFDIDNFKTINDNLGHQFGDVVLRNVSEELQSHFRDVDIIGRIGGDEFILFMKDTKSISIINEKAQMIRKALNKKFSHNGINKTISGSIGIAIYPQDGYSYDELYNSADKALYQSKARGKNCFTFFSSELAHGTMQNKTILENANRLAQSYLDAELINNIYNIIYLAKDSNSCIDTVLQFLAHHLNVDRAYTISSQNNAHSFSITHEWCNPALSSKMGHLQNIPKESLGAFFNSPANEDVVYSNVISAEACKELFIFAENQNIQSFIFVQAQGLDGPDLVLALDDCKSQRVWTEREINTLRNIIKLLSIYSSKT